MSDQRTASSGYIEAALLAVALIGLAAGLAFAALAAMETARSVWLLATLPVLLALLVQIVTTLRRGEIGLDLVAALSMTMAISFGQTLAGNVIALMYAGGQFLERYAQNRARREMTALLGRVARTTMRHTPSGLEEIAIEAVGPGDRLLIRKGEVVPVDGTVAEEAAVIDASALTGEALPIIRSKGDEVLSGTTSIGRPFDLVVVRRAADSAYAGIVRLVERAQQSKSPAVRLADRYSLLFLGLTILLATGAWLWTGDPIRSLAVLVVATPCPLILAVPVAVISGISRAARLGVLVKGGDALEAMANARVLIIDKTGTLTHGRAELAKIWTAPPHAEDELLRLAASLDQASTHVMAGALIEAARAQLLVLSTPTEVRESAGAGIAGKVDGHMVAVGGTAFVSEHTRGRERSTRPHFPPGAVTVDVAVDGALAGTLVLSDRVRPDAPAVLRRLRAAGIQQIVLASGDRADVADAVGKQLGVDDVKGGLSPEDKVDLVLAHRRAGSVMMVGDGVNDAPALAAADVGVAMGARGAAASSESADVVLLVDRLERLADAIAVAHRAGRIAVQSVLVGLGLSVAAMFAAAFGYLPPLQGALLQEAIDVAVVVNALRALKA